MTMYIAGGTEDDALKHGGRCLTMAGMLWSLVDQAKDAELTRLRRRARPSLEDPEIDEYSVEACREILELLENLPEALKGSLTDENFHIDADTATRIKARYPDFVASWEEKEGTVYSISGAVSNADQAMHFFRKAVKRGRPVLVD